MSGGFLEFMGIMLCTLLVIALVFFIVYTISGIQDLKASSAHREGIYDNLREEIRTLRNQVADQNRDCHNRLTYVEDYIEKK